MPSPLRREEKNKKFIEKGENLFLIWKGLQGKKSSLEVRCKDIQQVYPKVMKKPQPGLWKTELRPGHGSFRGTQRRVLEKEIQHLTGTASYIRGFSAKGS